jgi:hypothetical protein
MAATATKTRKKRTTKASKPAVKAVKKTVKAEKAAPKSRPILDEAGLKAAEAELRTSYPAIVKGSLRNVGDDPGKDPKWAHKRTVEIKCAHPGCTKVRRIATSDLHQVTMCEEHTHEYRLAARRKSRAAAAAE